MGFTTNQISQLPQKSYGVFVPFLANKSISGSGFASQVLGTDIAEGCSFSAGGTQFENHYYLYLKAGITYRFCFSSYRFNNAGIVQIAIKSDNGATTYNTLTSIDLYNSAGGAAVQFNQQTFSFSPSGFNSGVWVPARMDMVVNTKNASSGSYYCTVPDANAGFSFYEKYS